MENEYLKQVRKELNVFILICYTIFIILSLIRLTGIMIEYRGIIQIIEFIFLVLGVIGVCIRPWKVEITKLDNIVSVLIYTGLVIELINYIR